MPEFCGCECECGCCGGPPEPGTIDATSESGVCYSSGGIKLTVSDLSASGFGQTWGHDRSYRNDVTCDESRGNGTNWFVAEWPYLVEDNGTVIVVKADGSPLYFDDQGGGVYAGRYGILETLSEGAGEFKLAFPGGMVETFQDFSSMTIPGKILTQMTPGGKSISFSYNGSKLSQMYRSYTNGGEEITESFNYEYAEGSEDIASVELERRIETGPWSTIRRTLYEYYEAGDADGNEGDLKRVRHQVPAESEGWRDE